MAIVIDGQHWNYALDIYSRKGVSAACLHLQDERHVDINVLLIALYAALVTGRRMGPFEITQLDLSISKQRETLVVPLRKIRRFLKTMPFGVGSEPLRSQIKKVEILAEQFVQFQLARTADGLELGPPASSEEICWHVVNFFDPRPSSEGDLITRECIATIVQAAQEFRNA